MHLYLKAVVLVAGLKLGFASKALCDPVRMLALSGREKGLENCGEGGKRRTCGKDPRISARKRRKRGHYRKKQISYIGSQLDWWPK